MQRSIKTKSNNSQEIQRNLPVTLLVVFTGPSSPWNAR